MIPISLVHPELVVFDLDNTFYKYDDAHRMAFSALLAALQIPLDIELIDNFERARINVKNRLGGTASSHSRLLYLSELYSNLRLELNTSEILKLEATYWDAFRLNIAPFPNSITFVDNLQTRGISCALVTDLTSSIQYKKLETLRLANRFQYLVTSEEAGGDKTTGLPWKLLDERADLTRFSSIWYVGDSKFDLNPTMRRTQDVGFLKIDQGPIVLSGDHHLFSSFAELSALLE